MRWQKSVHPSTPKIHWPSPMSNHAAVITPAKHYENFPVASWLCPPRLRRPIAAIYWFARTADDLADEGDATAEQRLAGLQAYRADLMAVAADHAPSPRWAPVFAPLARALGDFALPLNLLTDLLDAFEQDVRFTASGKRYADDAELHDYCRRSANPIGRLLLHLYGINDATSLAQSDQICTALQLINFWQDLSVDVPRQRWYPSQATMRRFEVSDADLQASGPRDSASGSATKMVAFYVDSARAEMLKGSSLALKIPGRAGWELRLVVQGGLRILDKVEALEYATWRARPKLGTMDMPVLLWRAFTMPPRPAG